MQDLDPERLFKKYQSGQCTPEEQAVIEYYIIFEGLVPNNFSESEMEFELEDLRLKIEQIPLIKKSALKIWSKISIAAAACIAFFITLYFFGEFPGSKVNAVAVYANDVAPGSNKAYLILADGRRINLSDTKPGKILNQAGIQIIKTKNGQLAYHLTLSHSEAISSTNSNQKPQYNSIETPKGGQYMVYLPDGSKVWLNSASTLKFSTTFHNVTRKVELSGEAYFEVAKDKAHPFVVVSSTQHIKVLGTHFNISAYKDESFSQTTLLEGSVKITPTLKNNRNITRETILKPGEQSLLTARAITVSKADIQAALAWKNGYFILNHDTFRGIMNKISRWYNVEVVYDCNPDHIRIGGIVSRSVNISTVLKLMGETGKVHFKIEGRRVTVIE